MPDETINMIIDRLDRIEDKIDRIMEHGCSKSELHLDQEGRLRSLENDRAKAMGAIISVSAVIGFLSAWLSKKLGM